MRSRYAIKKQYIRFLFTLPTGTSNPKAGTTTTFSTVEPSRNGLDITHLWNTVQSYYHRGAAQSTKFVYASGQQRYLNFCSSVARQPPPMCESTLLLFVSHLAACGLSCTTIKVYLSTVRHFHTTYSHHKEFQEQLTPRLQQAIKGIKKRQARLKEPKIRRLITVEIMHKIHFVLSCRPVSFSTKMLWAAGCIAYFGFLKFNSYPKYLDIHLKIHYPDRQINIWNCLG